MQFFVQVYDHKGALERRLEVREDHLKRIKKYLKSGEIVSGGVLFEDEKMAGSVFFAEFESKEELLDFIHKDAYVKNDVWDLKTLKISKMAIPK